MTWPPGWTCRRLDSSAPSSAVLRCATSCSLRGIEAAVLWRLCCRCLFFFLFLRTRSWQGTSRVPSLGQLAVADDPASCASGSVRLAFPLALHAGFHSPVCFCAMVRGMCVSHRGTDTHNSIPIIRRPGGLGDDVFYGVEHRVYRGALPADPSLAPTRASSTSVGSRPEAAS